MNTNMPISPKRKKIAVRLGYWTGGFGGHNFYLGRYGRALIQVTISLIEIVFIVSLAIRGEPIAAFSIATILTFGVWTWGVTEAGKIRKSKPGDRWSLDAKGRVLS